MALAVPSRTAEAWLDAELHRLRVEHPTAHEVGRRLVGVRIPLLVAFGAAVATAVDVTIGSTNDMPTFVAAGHVLASGHPWSALADPSVQVGPLTLLVVELAGLLAAIVGVSAAIGATAALGALSTYAALHVARDTRPLAGRAAVLRDVGVGTTVVLGPVAVAALFGQLAELLVALVLVAAGQLAVRGRDGAAGAIVGLSVALKLWGVLGLPVLLLAARPRALAVRAAAFVAVVGFAFLPFFAAGDMNSFAFRWTVNPDTPLGLLDAGADFGWPFRVAQGVLALAVGVALARRPYAEPWMVVGGAIAVRLLTDPACYPYYGAALVCCLLVGLWPDLVDRWAWFWPVSLAVSIALTVGDYLAIHTLRGLPRDLLLVGALVWLFRTSGSAARDR
ncbi:MAG TPA: hypothetical protein VMI11_13695 [Actinomycetes bacterium]|nr:hypothetical protein [Actinomycetes bacterium]